MIARLGWPWFRPGMAVGLLGGSFDPAHAGHVHVTRAALSRFGLDRVVWLASPGNPLKARGPAPLARRLEEARRLMRHPRVLVTGLEAELGTRYTADTVAALVRAYPGVRFVWLMGADNLATLHLWDDWRTILRKVPVGVLARPGQRMAALNAPAARAFRAARLPTSRSRLLARAVPPAWVFANIPLRHESSTALRAGGHWTANHELNAETSSAG